MPQYKLNLFFSGAGQGWSETYYMNAATSDAAFTSFISVLRPRMAVLESSFDLVAVRISDDAIFKDSSLFNVNASQFPKYVSDTIEPCPSWVAALIHLQSGGIFWRSLYLRGMHQDALETNTNVMGRQNFYRLLTIFVQSLQNSGIEIKALGKPPAVPQLQVLSAIWNAPVTTITTNGAHGYNQGDRVQFYYMRGLKPRIGKQSVISVGAFNQFTVLYQVPVGYQPGPSAAVRRLSYGYEPVDFASFERIVHRITGRPFGQERGARRATA